MTDISGTLSGKVRVGFGETSGVGPVGEQVTLTKIRKPANSL